MDKNRLEVLLLNAIDLIKVEGLFNLDESFKEYITVELGLTEEEFQQLNEIE